MAAARAAASLCAALASMSTFAGAGARLNERGFKSLGVFASSTRRFLPPTCMPFKAHAASASLFDSNSMKQKFFPGPPSRHSAMEPQNENNCFTCSVVSPTG